MAKKGKQEPTVNRQVNFRAPEDLYLRIDRTARAFGLDVANFLRMLVKENLPAYEQRAEHIRQGEPPPTP